MNYRSITIIIYLLLFAFHASAQYAISVNISGYSDTVLLMTSYYGDKIKLVDTAYSATDGTFKFEGKKDLPGGIYMAVSKEKSKLFEFVVNDKQKFSLVTDADSYSLNMQVKGSEENEIFYDYLKFNEKLYSENETLAAKLKSLKESDQQYQATKKAMDSINQLSAGYKLKIIQEKPELFVSKIFNAMRTLEIPDEIANSPDSTAAFFYYKKHFFDYIDLSDSRLLRTPLLSRKVDEYFKNLVAIQPDSVIVSIDLVISKARPSAEVVSYLVWDFTSEYQNPEYMGFDKVYVHLVDQYFSKEEIEYTTPSILKSLQDRANIIRPIMIGEEAPNLILIDTSGNYRSFQKLTNDYIILFFWDTECGICKTEIVELQKIYKKIWFDFEIFAINVNADLEDWKKNITERKLDWINVNGTRSVTPDFHDLYDISGTPQIFILDKEHKIIAKNINAKQVLPFLEKYSKLK